LAMAAPMPRVPPVTNATRAMGSLPDIFFACHAPRRRGIQ
jgi:hypothetical protein